MKDFVSQLKPDNAFFDIPNLNYEFVQFQRMSNSKSTGLDGIGIILLKVNADIIAPHITGICNASISSDTFPNVWKKG